MSSIGPTCLYFEKKYITYLLSPFRACSHISPTPRNGDAIVFCSLPASRPGPNATREPSSLVPRTFSTSLLVVPASCFRQGSGAWLLLEYYVGGILLIWPIHLHPIFGQGFWVGRRGFPSEGDEEQRSFCRFIVQTKDPARPTRQNVRPVFY